METNHGDELDLAIDRALSAYSEAEPLAGLEGRVLHRVRVANVRRRRTMWVGLAAAAVAAGLLVTVLVQPRPMPVVTEVARVAPAPSVPKPGAQTHTARPRVSKRHVAHVRRLPKQETFPAAAPLTQDERALLAFAARHAAEVTSAFREIDRSGEPLDIAPIEIPPLSTDGSK